MKDSQTLVPLSMPAPSPMFPSEGTLMSLHTSAVGSDGGSPKSSATTITSGSSGFDGKSGEPGAPGEPV